MERYNLGNTLEAHTGKGDSGGPIMFDAATPWFPHVATVFGANSGGWWITEMENQSHAPTWDSPGNNNGTWLMQNCLDDDDQDGIPDWADNCTPLQNPHAETHQILVLDAEGPEYEDFRIINHDAHSMASQALCRIDFDRDFPRTEVVGLGDGYFALIRASDSAWQAWRFSIQSGQVVFLGLAQGERELLAAPFLSDLGLHVPLRGEEGPEIATVGTADFLESGGAPSCN